MAPKLALAALMLGTTLGFSLNEQLYASGLIGDHFGPPSFPATYDYIVVGAGTAGMTMAARLSQGGANSVAVVEAGNFYELNFSEVPGFAAQFIGTDPVLRNPQVDWDQVTEPMPGLGGRQVLYTTGRALGGSSARNFMLYTRSAKGAYQQWANKVGDPTYSFDQWLPYFDKSINYQGFDPHTRLANATPLVRFPDGVPTTGPLSVSYPNFATSFGTWVVKAFQAIGYKDTYGFMSGDILGYSYSLYTVDRPSQTRASSESSFFRQSLRSTSKLTTYINCLAKNILFNGTTATGLLVNSGGRDYVLSARKEVIVSAGVFRSPQLLMLSGIGPQAVLDRLNIPTVVTREGVGQNLVDHVTFGVDNAVNLLTHSRLADPTYASQQQALYVANRTGALTSPGGDIIAFEKIPQAFRQSLGNATLSGFAQLPADVPEVELFFQDAFAGNARDFIFDVPPSGANFATSSAALVAAFSRGNVTINSTDARLNPVVTLNLLGDARDQEVAVAAFKRIRAFAENSTTLGAINIGPEAFPGANVISDADILAAIRDAALPVYHAAGTCGMGVANDPMAVIDSHARVIGAQNLRVVDISSFPLLPAGHPQATVYALAEKIADLILKGH